jgi:hypothetical protein
MTNLAGAARQGHAKEQSKIGISRVIDLRP